MDIAVLYINLVLGLFVYFFWRLIVRRFVTNKRRAQLLTWAATIVSTPIVFFAIVMLWIWSLSYYPNRRFTKEAWQSDNEQRYELSKDIINRKLLIGKSKTEVKQILGKEDNEEQSNEWFYYLGVRPELFGIDPDYLHIQFKDSIVVSVYQFES